ncbi:DEKNAAC102961 [Brettanomyces naardenensis]|uniref:U1 small nuclear ribonucleoprotein component SNU71 n=1 Tax=Brettanomyces naardenensis TaxID=13370 RepID=A0A448YM29_BRENA|nr:DEKNAAC102961 [Brettanomyces naardenensis]
MASQPVDRITKDVSSGRGSKFLNFVLSSDGLVKGNSRKFPVSRFASGHGGMPASLHTSDDQLRALHFDSFVSLNDILTSSKTGLPLAHVNRNGELDSEQQEHSEGRETLMDVDDDIHLPDIPTHFVPLRAFEDDDDKSGSGSVSRALVVAVQNLPKWLLNSVQLLDSLLQYVIAELGTKCSVVLKDKPAEKVEIDPEFKWTYLDDDYVAESKIVFVQFDDILALHLFKRSVNGLEVASDTDTKASIKVTSKGVIGLALTRLAEAVSVDTAGDSSSLLTERITKLQRYAENRFKLGNHKPVDAEEYSNQYRVDPADIADIPVDMVQTVKEGIVDFRLHAIKVENEEREKRQLEDKRKTRVKLRRLFQDVNQNSGETGSERSKDDAEEEMEDIQVDGTDKRGEVGDKELEKLQEERIKDRTNVFYGERLEGVRRKDAYRSKLSGKFSTSIKHDVYLKETIPTARKRFMSTFVNGIQDTNNKIDENFNYYVRHNKYLQYRSKSKLEEERKDAFDRDDEGKELDVAEETSTFLASFDTAKEKPVRISIKKKSKSQVSSARRTRSSSDIFSREEVLSKIRSNVESTVEEYLGVKEKSLVEFIMDFLQKNYSKGAASSEYREFVSELSETLEEDAPAAAEKLYGIINSLT